MRLSLQWTATLFFFALLALSSCRKEDPEPSNPEEVITTLTYTLTPSTGGTPVVFSFTDLDGDGGDAPVIVNGVLQANTTYNGVVTLLNETESPADPIHLEVAEEGEDHQFFYENTLNNITISYGDQDASGKDLGLKTKLVTGAAEQGEMTVILRHEPNKSASGIAIDNAANAGGETDIEVKFNVDIQ